MSFWRRQPEPAPAVALDGFCVRPPAADAERVELNELISDDFLSLGPSICWGAYGQPGDLLLGAAAVMPQGNQAAFWLYVEKEYRRHGVGLGLVTEMYRATVQVGATGLFLYGHVHQDDPGVQFAKRCGMRTTRRRATYNAKIAAGMPTCERIVRRYRDHPHMASVVLEPVGLFDQPLLAEFLSANYPCGSGSFQLDRIRSGYYNTDLSMAARDGQQIVGALMTRTQPGVSSLFIDLILCEPERRSGPLPTAMLLLMARRALAAGVPRAVYEADPEHESFAVSFAKRCGAEPQHERFRYAIDHAGIEQFLANNAAPILDRLDRN